MIGRLPETDPDASTITASPVSIPAEGDSTSRITVQHRDANGNITTGATVALNGTRPSMESHRPSRVCTSFATATWVCRSGSPARESRCVNAAATRPVTLTCRTLFLPLPGEQCVAFDEAQRIPRSRLMSEFDLRSGVGSALPV